MELVTFKTSDNFFLDGAWYSGNNHVGILLLHGKGQNFYTSIVRWLAPYLNQLGYSCLSMNTRDHDHSEIDGITHCVFDIQAGIDFSHSRGIRELLIVGVSHASNKIVLSLDSINFQNQISGLILMPVGGIKMHDPGVWHKVLLLAHKIRTPLLIIQAGNDEFIPNSMELGTQLLDASVNSVSKELFVVEGANHSFSNNKEVVLEIIRKWLLRLSPNTQNYKPEE